MLNPAEIKARANRVRKRLASLYEEYPGYANFRPVREVMSMSDDICELVIALADNIEAFAPSGHIEAPVTTDNPGD